MRTIPTHVDAAKLSAINLGKQGESLACRVRFYASKWHEDYPEAEYQLFVSPPGATPYLADITQENGVVTWELTENDTTIPGSGSIELILMDGETKIKSVTYRTTLEKSPSSQEPGSAPQTHPTWWEGAIKKIEEATTAAIGEIDGAFESEKQEATAVIVKAAEDAIASIPEDYTTLSNDVSTLKDAKADAITDTSARAAFHELHAQRGPLAVTLYGKTMETGTGDKSPDNPYVISGEGAPMVYACGKNLVNVANKTFTSTLVVALTVPIMPGAYTVSFASFVSSDTDSSSGCVRFIYSDDKFVDCVFDRSNPVATVQVDAPVARMWIFAGRNSSGSFGDTASFTNLLIEHGSVATPYEPYIATTADLPLLPDGAPLMGNGTVDDTVENDVLSGCDKKIVLDGGDLSAYTIGGETRKYIQIKVDGISYRPEFNAGEMRTSYLINQSIAGSGTNKDPAFYVVVNGSVGIIIRLILPDSASDTLDAALAYLQSNPLIVFYRSADYTPDKDLRVCRVARRWKTLAFSDVSEFKARPDGISWDSVNTFPAGSDGTSLNPAVANQRCNVAAIANASNTTETNSAWVYSQNGRATVRISKTVRDYIANGGTLEISYPLTTPETYYTDPYPLRKPDDLTTDTVTVTGSGETAVEYPHDTKHYIDSKISELVTLALAGN